MIEVLSNVMSVEVKEGDQTVEVKKLGHKSHKLKLPDFKHGESIGLTVYLEEEL